MLVVTVSNQGFIIKFGIEILNIMLLQDLVDILFYYIA